MFFSLYLKAKAGNEFLSTEKIECISSGRDYFKIKLKLRVSGLWGTSPPNQMQIGLLFGATEHLTGGRTGGHSGRFNLHLRRNT